MNIIQKENPKGLDFKINEIQMSLGKELKKCGSIDIYPRCYVLEHESGRTIEHYGGNNEYEGNLIVSEGNKMFFTAERIREQLDNFRFQTSISLFGILNLNEFESNSNARLDEEILSDIVDIVKSCDVNKIKIFTNFYEIYDVTYFKDSTRNFATANDNIHPYFYFRIDFGIVYELKQNC